MISSRGRNNISASGALIGGEASLLNIDGTTQLPVHGPSIDQSRQECWIRLTGSWCRMQSTELLYVTGLSIRVGKKLNL